MTRKIVKRSTKKKSIAISICNSTHSHTFSGFSVLSQVLAHFNKLYLALAHFLILFQVLAHFLKIWHTFTYFLRFWHTFWQQQAVLRKTFKRWLFLVNNSICNDWSVIQDDIPNEAITLFDFTRHVNAHTS